MKTYLAGDTGLLPKKKFVAKIDLQRGSVPRVRALVESGGSTVNLQFGVSRKGCAVRRNRRGRAESAQAEVSSCIHDEVTKRSASDGRHGHHRSVVLLESHTHVARRHLEVVLLPDEDSLGFLDLRRSTGRTVFRPTR
jgi:hypothetical protein